MDVGQFGRKAMIQRDPITDTPGALDMAMIFGPTHTSAHQRRCVDFPLNQISGQRLINQCNGFIHAIKRDEPAKPWPLTGSQKNLV